MNKTASVPTRIGAGLVLHDADDKETRKQIVKDFKKNMTVDELSQFTYCHLSAESVIGLAAKEALRKLNKG